MKAHITYQKFLHGDSMTDDELLFSYEKFRKAALLLIELGPVFKLAGDEALRVEYAFEDYIKARGLTLPVVLL